MNKINKIFSFVESKGYGTKILSDINQFNKISENTLIKFKCICGNIFEKKYSQIRDQAYILCQNCVLEKRVAKRKKNFNEIKQFFNNKNYKILSNQNYLNNYTKIEVEDNEGYRGFLSYRQIRKGDNIVKFSEKTNKKYFLYNIKLYEKKNNYSSSVLNVLYDKDNKSRTVISVKCKCGKIYETTYIYYLTKDGRCADCVNSLSSYEKELKNFLLDNDINFISEYSFNNCRDKNPLLFDFYLPDYNILIEIDGEGHYYPCHFNRINRENAIRTFNLTKYHDLLKNIYCMETGIFLLRIPYWRIKKSDSYKKIIISLLCSYSR